MALLEKPRQGSELETQSILQRTDRDPKMRSEWKFRTAPEENFKGQNSTRDRICTFVFIIMYSRMFSTLFTSENWHPPHAHPRHQILPWHVSDQGLEVAQQNHQKCKAIRSAFGKVANIRERTHSASHMPRSRFFGIQFRLRDGTSCVVESITACVHTIDVHGDCDVIEEACWSPDGETSALLHSARCA